MNSNQIAVLGDPECCIRVKDALKALGFSWLQEGSMELQDEWQVCRWMREKEPKYVFVCLGTGGMASVRSFLFTMRGCLNVITGAVGYADRLILVSPSMGPDQFLFHQLCELYQVEKQLDFRAALPEHHESPAAFANRCVLVMRDGILPTTQANAQSTTGTDQRGKVPDQVLPQPQGAQTDPLQVGQREDSNLRMRSAAVLEVHRLATEGKAPGDLRPKCHTSAG